MSCLKNRGHSRLKKGDKTEQKMGLHDKKDIFMGCDRDIDSLWNKLDG